MTRTDPFRYFKTSPEIIRLAVMLYVRFPLSLRNAEDLLHKRGIEISHETVRYWWNRFGPIFASKIRRRHVQQVRDYSNWQWHLDEVFVSINGKKHYLWRAVDHEGEVLESYVTKRRDRKAALEFPRRPTWPLGQTYTKGVLGIDQRSEVAADIAHAEAERSDWMTALAEQSFETIRADPVLMARATATAEPLFGQNCQACHGDKGTGGPGFPRLSDDIWIWGGTADEIAETIRVGVNSAHSDTRFAQMPAFGRDELLTRPQIATLSDYVLTLSNGVRSDDDSEGAILFQENCAACHGKDARGVEDTGAPNLTDADWLYGDDADAIHTTLFNGRQGTMPSWANRLSEVQIRMLALYVEGLSRQQP